MPNDVPMVEVWRGDFLECVHHGAAVICGADGEIIESWGNPAQVILPRSSCKIMQALPLVESGAADALGLKPEHLALACASHRGAHIHTDTVRQWLNHIGTPESALRCGAHPPGDRDEKFRLIRAHEQPGQVHNNCSGKHTGFLSLSKHIGADADYIDVEHPVQLAARAVIEDLTQDTVAGWVIDGCSAPNFAVTLAGLARGLAYFADSHRQPGTRAEAASRLMNAALQNPVLIAGQNAACTKLIQAGKGNVFAKTGAEGVYVAAVRDRGFGIALKITDGATRASELAISALLHRLAGFGDGSDIVNAMIEPTQRNHRGLEVGVMKPANQLLN